MVPIHLETKGTLGGNGLVIMINNLLESMDFTTDGSSVKVIFTSDFKKNKVRILVTASINGS